MATDLKTRAAAIAAALSIILSGVYAAEGGYVNDPHDRGGATNHGITERVARANGYRGDMRKFPKHCSGPAKVCADTIYVRDYIAKPGYMPLIEIEPAVAAELVDTAVNMGASRPNRWFRQSMNALSGSHLLERTASLGPADVAAYRSLQVQLGVIPACIATLDALDLRQRARYFMIVRNDPSQRRFLDGWLRLRIGNIKRSTCGQGTAE